MTEKDTFNISKRGGGNLFLKKSNLVFLKIVLGTFKNVSF